MLFAAKHDSNETQRRSIKHADKIHQPINVLEKTQKSLISEKRMKTKNTFCRHFSALGRERVMFVQNPLPFCQLLLLASFDFENAKWISCE